MFKTNNKKIALFDLDETLVQSDCRNHALKLICEDLSWRTGIWTKELFNKLIKIWQKEKDNKKKYDWDYHIAKLCSQLGVKKHYNYEKIIKQNLNKAKLFPDAIPILKYLKSHGYKISIITNGLKKYQLPIIKKLKLLKYVSKVYAPNNGYLKPDKRIFNHDFENRKISIYIDDQFYQGIYLGKKLKAKTFLICRDFHSKKTRFIREKLKSEALERKFNVQIKNVTPDYIITDLRQIKKYIKQEK